MIRFKDALNYMEYLVLVIELIFTHDIAYDLKQKKDIESGYNCPLSIIATFT